jgi:hypothetical protein
MICALKESINLIMEIDLKYIFLSKGIWDNDMINSKGILTYKNGEILEVYTKFRGVGKMIRNMVKLVLLIQMGVYMKYLNSISNIMKTILLLKVHKIMNSKFLINHKCNMY